MNKLEPGKGIAIIGPSYVEWWKAIENACLQSPTRWWSVAELVELTGLNAKSGSSLVYRLVKGGVLKFEGRKGSRVYRLADQYLVAAVVSHRSL
jgi:DNA-binding IclR family transcriptional regulator